MQDNKRLLRSQKLAGFALFCVILRKGRAAA
jgi:hypothetical protein